MSGFKKKRYLPLACFAARLLALPNPKFVSDSISVILCEVQNCCSFNFSSGCELLSTIKNADYEMDENLRQRVIDKFWGKTATYDSCYQILEKLSLLSFSS